MHIDILDCACVGRAGGNTEIESETHPRTETRLGYHTRGDDNVNVSLTQLQYPSIVNICHG